MPVRPRYATRSPGSRPFPSANRRTYELAVSPATGATPMGSGRGSRCHSGVRRRDAEAPRGEVVRQLGLLERHLGNVSECCSPVLASVYPADLETGQLVLDLPSDDAQLGHSTTIRGLITSLSERHSALAERHTDMVVSATDTRADRGIGHR